MNLNLSEKLKTGLTPQEKIDCYEQAKREISYSDCGICYELSLCFEPNTVVPMKNIWDLFSEFAEHRPKYKRRHSMWFNSTEERIQVLNKLIEEQKKLI